MNEKDNPTQLKPYCEFQNGRLICRPPILPPRDKLRPSEEIAWHVDKRSLSEIHAQIYNGLNQLYCRATLGDRVAVAEWFCIAREVTAGLDKLAFHQKAIVQMIAEINPQWPLLLCLNPSNIKRAREKLKSLGVGNKALTPTYSAQRIDLENCWTKLAIHAYSHCRQLKLYVANWEKNLALCTKHNITLKYWHTKVPATYYESKKFCWLITDWQHQCETLTEPINTKSIKSWWSVVQLCVMEQWFNSKECYAEALSYLGSSPQEEYRRRSEALNRLKRAFVNLVTSKVDIV